MAPRFVAVVFVLVVACVPASSRRSDSYAVIAPRSIDTAEPPATPEERAEEAIEEVAEVCGPVAAECGVERRATLYPDDEDYPQTTAERFDPRNHEVRSLGFMLRWEPGQDTRLALGNSPTWSGDPQADPP